MAIYNEDMDTIYQANIFFFISSVGFIIFFTLIAIALIQLIRLLKNVNAMAEKVEGNIETISEEAKDMVLEFRDSPVMGFLFGRRRKKTAKAKEK